LKKVILATRKSPLALVQAELAAAHLRSAFGVETEFLKIVTSGDSQADWSLERQGGKGLFTGELEAALRRGDAEVAVHSAKDLPGEMAPDLAVAGCLPRGDARDVLVLRAGITAPESIATGSPRRRLQLAAQFPGAQFREIRGNVDTRLRKVAEGLADATVLAAAGLARLGIRSWPGLEFHPLDPVRMVPAVGQGAIALQCRAGDATRFAAGLDERTSRAVAVERELQGALGAGCQTAFGAHAGADTLHLFHEDIGYASAPLAEGDFLTPGGTALRLLRQFGLVRGQK
jgi:hydroxymethylbilane synthase